MLSFSWIGLVVAGVVAMFLPDYRAYAKEQPQEAIFAGLFLISIFCYDYLIWARGSFMRFSIPAMPLIFFALMRWLPKDRRFLWCVAAMAPLLAACSAVGIKNVFSFLR